MTLIYGTTPHDTNEIVALRRTLNENDAAFSALRSIHSRDQRRLADQYDELMAAQRPTYPTEEQLRGLNMVATMVRGDVVYGDHLGAARDVDRQAGRALPKSVSFSSSGALLVELGAVHRRLIGL